MFSPNGRETTLAELQKKDLDHVIWATEFRSAEQLYFSGDFVYSYALGNGKPAELSLARAVQASAAFPGGFPPATLATKQHKFTGAPSPAAGGPPEPPSKMVLTDGGVYDNDKVEISAEGLGSNLLPWKLLWDKLKSFETPRGEPDDSLLGRHLLKNRRRGAYRRVWAESKVTERSYRDVISGEAQASRVRRNGRGKQRTSASRSPSWHSREDNGGSRQF